MVQIIVLAVALAAAPESLSPIALPGAVGPVGFDDLRFSPELRRVVVPAGRTGRIDLVDPESHAIEEIAGFSSSRQAGRGHGESTTSADTGEGLVFASDRTRQELVVADPKTKKIVARVKLGGGPDYVRWVAPLREVWVTEPGKKVVETFRLETGRVPKLTRTGTIAVPDGPESLEIDPGRHRAYANTWQTSRSRSTSNRGRSARSGRTDAAARGGSRWTHDTASSSSDATRARPWLSTRDTTGRSSARLAREAAWT